MAATGREPRLCLAILHHTKVKMCCGLLAPSRGCNAAMDCGQMHKAARALLLDQPRQEKKKRPSVGPKLLPTVWSSARAAVWSVDHDVGCVDHSDVSLLQRLSRHVHDHDHDQSLLDLGSRATMAKRRRPLQS